MLQTNIKIFGLFLLIIILFILLRTGQIFDAGYLFYRFLSPPKVSSRLLLPPDQLAEEYKNLLADNNQLKNLTEENNQLRNLLNFKQTKKYNLQVANILSRDPINQNIIVLDVGLNQGVLEGQAVVVNDGIIVGKIIEVSPTACKARLLSDSLSKLSVKVGENYAVSGLLSGSLGLGMNLNYIPQAQDIKTNDMVVTTALEEKIPSGLTVGKIQSVSFQEEEIFKQAAVEPIVDYSSLNILAVIL